MSKNMATISKIDLVTTSIVNELGEVGVFHYNKLAYLFEYFFIKNFGMRFIDSNGKTFIKLPHGPVIQNYKNQIKSLCDDNILSTDLSILMAKRKLDEDDYNYHSVRIYKAENTEKYTIQEDLVLNLLRQILSKFANLSVTDIEKVVYKTAPVRNYLEKIDLKFKRKTGGHILTDCIKMKDFKSVQNKGHQLALEHLKKYPNIDFVEQARIADELADLEKLRPKWVKQEENQES